MCADGKWCSRCAAVTATVVTASGGKAHGVITEWIGPAECVLSTGARGVLAEIAERRK